MTKNRTGQCFVDARDPTKWYGPITYAAGDTWMMDEAYHGISESCIVAGIYLRIPPHPDLPPGLTTRECRLPKKGERFVDIDGDVFCATEDWVAIPACVYYGRRWIVEAEPEAEPAEPRDENQNFAAKYRETQVEIDKLTRERDKLTDLCMAAGFLGRGTQIVGDGYLAKLTRERDEARAACAATLPLLRRCQEFLNLNLDALAGRSHCAEILNALADVWYEGDLVLPNLGQSLLDDNARLLAVVDKLPKTEQFQRRGKETDHAETDHV